MKQTTLAGLLAAVVLTAALAVRAPAATDCPADCGPDPDWIVDIGDFLALLAQWGQEQTSCDLGLGAPGVGVEEFLAMLATWGPCE